MKKQISFLIALIIILFLAGIVVALIISMQEKEEKEIINNEAVVEGKDEENDFYLQEWKTYVNNFYGFEIKYPTKWEIDDGWDYDEILFYEEGREDFTLAIITRNITRIHELENENEDHLEKFEKIYLSEGPYDLVKFIFIKNNKIIQIVFNLSFLESEEIIDDIFSTFRFLDEHTYVNNFYGFEIKYPLKWSWQEKERSFGEDHYYEFYKFEEFEGILRGIEIVMGIHPLSIGELDKIMSDYYIVSVEDINIKGLEGYKIYSSDEDLTSFLVFREDDLFAIGIWFESFLGEEEINKIISTFKFLD